MAATKLPGAQITDGTIADADIASAAAIAVSKLAGSASTVVGQKAAGGVVNLTPSEAKTILSLSNVPDKDCASWTIFNNIVWSGEVKVASGDTDYFPPLLVSVPTGYTCTLKNIRYRINSGTSVSFKLQKNGSDLSGYGTSGSPLTCNGTTAETASDATLADNDSLEFIVTAVSGTPKNLSCRVEFLLTKS